MAAEIIGVNNQLKVLSPALKKIVDKLVKSPRLLNGPSPNHDPTPDLSDYLQFRQEILSAI